ncbi:MAG: hypothetical protein AAF441_26540, partial [Pseudomonadota bacterium]
AIALTNMYFGAQAISKTGQELPDWRELLRQLVEEVLYKKNVLTYHIMFAICSDNSPQREGNVLGCC